MNAEILLTIKLQQQLFADPRRIELLKQVDATGSISQGAKLANISYKSAWDAINEMNTLSEHLLVERATGGKGGGGATLTRYGKRLIQLYSLLGQIQQKAFDVLQDDQLPLDSLLAAIARFSLQTSARNQFFGTVEQISPDPIQELVYIRLANGNTVIKAAITKRSVDNLRLTPGKEVLTLIKAPWITLSNAKADDEDNQLPGTIASLQRGEKNSEVIIELEGGEQLCAMVHNQALQAISAEIGMAVFAQFSAESVILASLN
jgi:molybdate transport system regulatory protein